MDYLDIILKGFESKKNFSQFLYAEFKKLNESEQSSICFFEGCKNAIASLEILFSADLNNQKRCENLYINGLSLNELTRNKIKGTLFYKDIVILMQGLVDTLELIIKNQQNKEDLF